MSQADRASEAGDIALDQAVFRVEDVPRKGIERTFSLTDNDRAALSKRLEVNAVLRLAGRFRIADARHGRFRLTGTVEGEVEQLCGVCLEPLRQAIDEQIAVEFREQGSGDDAPAGDFSFDPLDDFEIEPIVNGNLDVGRVINEVITSAIDPYPRHADAALDANAAEATPGDADEPPSPFAALEELKNRLKP